MSIKKDKYFISLANNLAQNSNGFTGPNPSVGAVVVKDSKVEAEVRKEVVDLCSNFPIYKHLR